jgi:hypothetical protein
MPQPQLVQASARPYTTVAQRLMGEHLSLRFGLRPRISTHYAFTLLFKD